jgi:hypothetical protein
MSLLTDLVVGSRHVDTLAASGSRTRPRRSPLDLDGTCCVRRRSGVGGAPRQIESRLSHIRPLFSTKDLLDGESACRRDFASRQSQMMPGDVEAR